MSFSRNASVDWKNAIFLAGFCGLAYAVSIGATADIDQSTVIFFRQFVLDQAASLLILQILRDLTSLGSMVVLFAIVLAVACYLGLSRRPHQLVTLLSAVIGGLIIVSCLKWGFSRPRPDLAVSGVQIFTTSFPSQHAALSTIVYLTMARLIDAQNHSSRLSMYCTYVALIVIALIGLSRVCLGLHYPTDILAGWCVGAAWTLCWRYNQSAVMVEEPAA